MQIGLIQRPAIALYAMAQNRTKRVAGPAKAEKLTPIGLKSGHLTTQWRFRFGEVRKCDTNSRQ